MKQGAFGKVVWTLYSGKEQKYYRMWVIQNKRGYMFQLTKRNASEERWELVERCTTGRAKWWTKIFFLYQGCVPVE